MLLICLFPTSQHIAIQYNHITKSQTTSLSPLFHSKHKLQFTHILRIKHYKYTSQCLYLTVSHYLPFSFQLPAKFIILTTVAHLYLAFLLQVHLLW